MPYASLTARDTTADKIPSKCCGLGAFTGGAGFGLFVSVPIALVGKAARATKRRFERKARQKNVEKFIDSWGQNTAGEERSPAPSSNADQIEREKEILRAQAQRQQEIASLPTTSEVVAKQSLAQEQKPKPAKWLGDIGALGVQTGM